MPEQIVATQARSQSDVTRATSTTEPERSDNPNQQPAKPYFDALTHQKSIAELEMSLANLKLERAKSERELQRLAAPWWRSWNVTAIGALLAAIAPLTAGIQGHFEKVKQVELAEQKQQHEIAIANQKQIDDIRNHYLDRLKNPEERRRTLRFLFNVSPDPALKEWAAKEMPIVEQERTTQFLTAEKLEQAAVAAERKVEIEIKNAETRRKFFNNSVQKAAAPKLEKTVVETEQKVEKETVKEAAAVKEEIAVREPVKEPAAVKEEISVKEPAAVKEEIKKTFKDIPAPELRSLENAAQNARKKADAAAREADAYKFRGN